MARSFQRSYKFLPEVFQTTTNRKFLSNTMDHLMVPGEARQLNYFIGRKYALGSKLTDKFLGEGSDLRNAYQLEVGAAVADPQGKYVFGTTAEDFINSLEFYGVDTSDLKNVLRDDFKPADFKIDLDKLVNYGQYYWLPYGPDVVPLDLASSNATYIKLTQFADGIDKHFDVDHFYVTARNTPIHATDSFPTSTVTRAVKDSLVTFKIPLTPAVRETQNQLAVPPASMIGVSINGHPFYTYTMGSKEKLGDETYTINTTQLDLAAVAFVSEPVTTNTTFDRSEDLQHTSTTPLQGHPDSDGIFHYHAYTAALGDSLSGHSRILGYAFDGFPIYGPRGFRNADGTGGVTTMVSSYRLKTPNATRGTPDGRYVEDYEYVPQLGTVDQNNGRFAVTPEYPQGTYAYFMTLDDLTTQPTFPYILGPSWSGNAVQQSATIKPPSTATVFDSVPSVDIERDIVGKSRYSFGDLEFVNGLRVSFDSTVLPANYRNRVYYVEGVGRSIDLVPEDELIPNTRESPSQFVRSSDLYDNAGYSANSYDGIEYRSLDKHYITINRGSQDRNAWSRSNRWFHYRALEVTAKALNKAVTSKFDERAKRPIIEFEPNIALWNHSRRNIAVVDLFDTQVTDALSTVMSSSTDGPNTKIEGVTLEKGMRVVYANDTDPAARTKIYEVDIVNLNEGDNYNLTLPQLGGSSPSPFQWLTNTGTEFHFQGGFTGKDIKIKQNDVLLAPGVDYTFEVVSNLRALTSINITKAGSGYLTAPAVTVTGDGTGATAEALIDETSGSVIQIRVTNPGSGYTTATITIAPAPTLPNIRTATATPVLAPEQRISVNLVQGLAQSSAIELQAFEYTTNIALNPIATVEEYDGVFVRPQQGFREPITANSDRNWYYYGGRWRTSADSELKTVATQAPLFDLVDENHVSIGDQSVYVGSTFRGSKLFSYKKGVGSNDTELGFPVSYRAVGLTGDIQFDWNHSIDKFDFTLSSQTRSQPCESFYALNTESYTLRAVVTATTQLQQLPVMDLRYIDAETSVLDLKVSTLDSEYQSTILVEVNDKPLYQGQDYDLVDRVIEIRNQARDVEKQIKPNARLLFRKPLRVGDKLLLTQWTNDDIINTDLSWKLPLSLTTNPYNQLIREMTFSDLSSHLISGAQILKSLDGTPIGDNNLFIEPSVSGLCKKFGYHNGNSLLAMALLKNRDIGYVQSLEYAKDEYTKFKNSMIQRYEFALYDEDNVIPTMLDNLLDVYVSGKTQESAFYDSDMLPGFTNFVSNSYTVRYQQDKTFPISTAFVDEEESRRAVLVYHNSSILARFQDYDFDDGMPYLTIKPEYALAVGDTITLREYDTTVANWIPTTPAKLGLAPVHTPKLLTIPTVTGSATVIQGHDGSWTPAYGDQRDDLMLEIETRIYNNIKKTSNTLSQEVLNKLNPLPGKFRSTVRDFGNSVNIMDRFFGQWLLKSRMDFSTNTSYDANNNWTWNYRGQQDAYGEELLVGNWFGIYRYYFDTEYPHLMPWRMLGFAEEPTWWQSEYGPAPYTRQNFKIWDDLEVGLIRQGERAGTDLRYARQGSVKLRSIIPVNENGVFLSPLDSGLVRIGNRSLLTRDWIFGDAGPVEQAWIRSSEYQFAKQMYHALTSARYYFGAAFDLLDTKIDTVSGIIQRVYDNTVTDVGTVIRSDSVENSLYMQQTAGYFTWIEARARSLNIDPQEFIEFVTGIQPNLMFRMTGFTDKSKLQLFINSVSPGSNNTLSLLPENNYQLILDQSAPTANLVYSGVTVSKTQAGWRVEGYDTQNTLFHILPSIVSGEKTSIRVGGTEGNYLDWRSGQNYVSGQYVSVDRTFYRVVRDHISDSAFVPNSNYAPMQSPPVKGGVVATIWKQYSDTPVKVQYGTVYKTSQEVFDFLQAYGRFLESQGFVFDQFDSDLGQVRDWLLSGKEFLFWTLENWRNGSVITLSPASRLVKIYVPQGELDSLYSTYSDPRSVLDQNFLPMRATDLAVDRNFDLVTVVPTRADKSIYLLKAVISDYDHLAIFDNVTDFNDQIYSPTTGARQERLKIRGSKSNAWNGKIFAPGFTIDLANINEWSEYTSYTEGDLIRVGTKVYSANKSHRSGTLFDYSLWSLLAAQPDLTLQPNLDSLANRLEKFYGLSSEQISSDVSNYARHLIGFQPRDYLKDLLVDDESQFKFYQGMIKQKGTSESVAKLLRGANPGGIPQVDIKDEWALRVGEFGLADNTDEVEVLISEVNLEFNKVMLDFSGNESQDRNIVAVQPSAILDQGELPTGNLFPTTSSSIFAQKNAGYAKIDQVNTTLLTQADLATVNLDVINGDGQVIWIAKNARRNSLIYRTRRLGPFTATVLANSVLSLDSSIKLEAQEPIWFLPIETFTSSTTTAATTTTESITGYRVVDQVNSANRFTLVGGIGDIAQGQQFRTFIVKFEPAQFSTLDTIRTAGIVSVTKANPAIMTFDSAVGLSDGLRVFVDSAQGMTEINNKVYYVKKLSDTTVSLFYDADFLVSVDSDTYGDYTSGGRAFFTDLGVGNTLYQLSQGQRLWIDSYQDKWTVFKKMNSWQANDFVEPASILASNLSTNLYAWDYRNIVWMAAKADLVPSIIGETDTGVLVYERVNTGADLTQVKVLRSGAPVVSNDCDFGAAISSLDIDTLIVGCPLDSIDPLNPLGPAITNNGSIQLWKRNDSGNWLLHDTIHANTPQSGAKFGSKITRVNSELAFVSAPGEGKIYKLSYDADYTYSVLSASQTNPVRLTFTSEHGLPSPSAIVHGMNSGTRITLSQIGGMNQINGDTFYVKSVSATQVDLYADSALTASINGVGYDAYTPDTGFASTVELYRVLPVTTGITATNQGFVLEYDNSVLAIGDTDAAEGRVRVYTVDNEGDLTYVNAATGTTTNPITTDLPIDFSNRNGRMQLAVGSYFPTFDSSSSNYDNGSLPTDSTVTDGIVRIFEIPSTGPVTAEPYQILLPPNVTGSNVYGIALRFTDDGKLLVSNSTAPVNRQTTFDSASTSFDALDTEFFDLAPLSGSIDSYGWYETQFSWVESIANPVSRVTDPTTGFGVALSTVSNSLFVASPWRQTGKVYEYLAISSGLAVESQQQDVVDTSRINRALSYDIELDRVVNFQTLWDPLKDLHDAVAITNLDYINPGDPAIYQADNPGNTYWAEEQVGRTWWDNSQSIWLWYEQGDLSYKLKNWGRLFPGTEIVVSEWVESTVVPAAYNPNGIDGALGVPFLGSDQPYSTKVVYDREGEGTLRYYFWVANKSTIAQSSKKTLSAAGIRNLLLNGPSKWVAVAGPQAILTQNLSEDVVNSNVALQVEVLRAAQYAPRHVEWTLLNEGDDVMPPDRLVNKIIDSLAGEDALGNAVPDINLPTHKKLGINIRPRQTVFQDRIQAIQACADFLNDELGKLILVDQNLGELESADSIPLPTEIVDVLFDGGNTTFDTNSTRFISDFVNWDESVLTYADIIEDDLPGKPVDYKILVQHNENLENLWTIYQWDGRNLILERVQKYDTTRYWSRVDYYSSEFPQGSVPDLTVRTEQEFLDGEYNGLAVKILGPDYWRVVRREQDDDITILALQNGTIELDISKDDFDSTLSFDTVSYDVGLFDPQPTIELRNILTAMRDSIFSNTNRTVWNRWFFHMVRHAFSEQRQLDWAFKSSFIKVKNTLAELTERPVFSLDVQDSLEKYIREVKPYHTKIREYTVAYTGGDAYQSLSTDFDNPPHYNNGVLSPSRITDPLLTDLYTQWPWISYRDGRSYSVTAVVITDGGQDYVSPPVITLSGGTTVGGIVARPARARSILGVNPQDYTSLSSGSTLQLAQNLPQTNSPEDNYFNFRKVWLDQQADADSTINNQDLTVKQAPNADGKLLRDMVGEDALAIKRIEIIDEGAGYLTPPTVIFTGGGGTGAKAYAVLGETSARMLRTGLKFDRVKGTADILYRDVRAPQKDNPAFDDWHAADRIAAYYDPRPGQISLPQRETSTYIADGEMVEFALPSNFMYTELLMVARGDAIADPNTYIVHESTKTVEFLDAPDQGTVITLILNPPLQGLLLGADFDKTKIVGPKFDTGPGFDGQGRGFDSIAFDNWDLDPNGGFVEYGGIDTYQESGRFETVVGYDPTAEIVTDGAAFLSPDTAPSPEELLGGQVFDTLDIKVYSNPGANQTVFLQNFRGDNATTNFVLDPMPAGDDNITVFANGLTQYPGVDFTVDYTNNEIVLTSPPSSSTVITIAVTEDYGPTIEKIQTFVATGSEQLYTVANVGAADSLRQSIVLVNGTKVTHTFTNSGEDLVFDLGTAPAAASIVRIVVYLTVLDNIVLKNYAESYMQTLIATGAANYQLDHVPGVPIPFTASTVVSVVDGDGANPLVRVGQRLSPADVAYHVADGTRYAFRLPDCPGFIKSALVKADVEVSVNGVELDASEYQLDLNLDQILVSNIPATGNLIAIAVLPSGDYYVRGSTLYLNASVVQSSSGTDTVLLINTYNDTALNDMRTEVYTNTSANSIYYGGFGIYGFGIAPIDLTSIAFWESGQVKLSKPIVSVTQANVYKNGVFLVPGQDWYVVDGTRDLINIEGGMQSLDTVVVHYFAGSLAKSATGFRIFKDMLGRFKYYRIAAENSAKLTAPLDQTDTIIYVNDTAGLTTPDRASNRPGIIMVGKERIEYWVKGAVYLDDLRRGTLGTGATTHPTDTLIVDMGEENLLPPSDVVQGIRVKTNGIQDTFNVPVELETAFHSSESIQVYVGGKLVTSGYTLTTDENRYSSVVFDRAPKQGLWLIVATKQGANWNNVLAPETSLQDSNTLWAEFIRSKPAIIELG